MAAVYEIIRQGKKDLHYIQKGCWGDLGYEPTVWY
jgi:acyl CoA:acetate/3-ketoacid CoA transferase alpha subunit